MNKINKWFAIFNIFLSIIIIPVNCYASGNDTDEINYLSTDEKYKIEKFIEENMNKGKIPGLSVTVVKGNKTIYQKGFGYSDLEAQNPVDSKSLFELGSNSKAFTALAILNLQKDGFIKLDDEVTKYIPWLKVKYKGNDVSIKIEQILHHTSGIPFNTIDKIPISNEDNALEETVKTLIDIELDSEPGEKYQYATINYDVLGFVIEKVTGLNYEKYIEENVLKSMELNNTYLYKNEIVNEHMAKGYIVNFLKPEVYDAPIYRGNKPAGYIITNGEDIAKWLKIQMGFSSGSKFDKDIIEESHKANRKVAPLGDGSSYAGGWFVYQIGGGEISHGGSNPNYSSFIVFRPEDKVGIAVLSNINSEYVQAIAKGVNDILQGEICAKEVKDLNKSADKISILIICITSLIIITTMFFMIKMLKDILKHERKFNKKGLKFVLKLIFSLIFMVGINYSIYLIPYILYYGVSWEFVFIWLPKSIKIALYLGCISLWIVYVYAILMSFYKKKDDKSMLILSIFSAASGFGNALIIFTINMAINSSDDVKIKLLIYFILGIILYVYGQKIVREKLIDLTNGIVYSKRMEIVKCLLKSNYNKFEGIENGRIQSTLNNDTEVISRFVNILISGITSAITLTCCFFYLGFINIYALLLSIAIVVIIASIYYIVGKYANKLGEDARDLQNIFFKFINDLIGGIKELSLNVKRKNEFQRDMEESCDKYRVKRGKAAIAFANMFVIGELLFVLAIGFIVFIFPLILNNLERTSLTSYVFILLYMTGPVHGILDTIPNAIDVKICLKKINNLISEISYSTEEEYDFSDESIFDEFTLRLNGVEYKYEKTDGQEFKVGPINYEFKSGEIIFITGGNGSGKSTLAKLLTGLYLPTKGEMTLNNKMSQKLLNESFSTVFSDFYLFDKLYGIDYKGKDKDIQKYLEVLQLDSKIQIIDGKFSTTKLSTGQKKRLALLVTRLENRPIYLFDEWAADQDPEFRLFFYEKILPELKNRGKCVIAITHDDRYFNHADKIIKMEMGKMN